MSKLTTLIVIPRYPHKKENKKKRLLSLIPDQPNVKWWNKKKNKLKKWQKKKLESAQVNLLNTIPRSWN
jgi:hypothetical protein